MNTCNLPVIILAGGKSSRMQTDKSLLPFGGYSSMCEYQYRKLQSHFKKIYISSKSDKFDFLEYKENLILDTQNISSPMVALLSIFNTIKEEYVFILAVDIPLISYKTIETLYNSFIANPCDIVIAKDSLGNVHNLCGIFHRNILKDIEEMITKDIHKINYLIKNSNYHEVLIEESDQFLNLNDKENYEKACRLLKGHPPVK